jgi:hypothetical protein
MRVGTISSGGVPPSEFLKERGTGQKQMIDAGVDYISGDFLAEAVIPNLIKAKRGDTDSTSTAVKGTGGYAASFNGMFEQYVDEILEKEIKVTVNAGGLDPFGLAQEFIDLIGPRDINIAIITGDGILHQLDELREAGVSLDNMDTGESFSKIEDDVVAANVYTGAFPVAEALEKGADFIITGRAVDPAGILGPMIYEFGWEPEDYDLLASGLIAGHLLECGQQVSGVRYMYGWEDVEHENFGFPIAEMEENGEFVITKPDDTGGTITLESVKEQLVYEIKDPERYLSPDVIADFTSPRLKEVGENRVQVTGCKANGERPNDLKAAIFYPDGYRADSMEIYSWPNAIEKAEWKEHVTRDLFEDELDDIRLDYIGWNACHFDMAPKPENPPEIVLRFAARDRDPDRLKEAMDIWSSQLFRQAPPAGRVMDHSWEPNKIYSFWPALVPREMIDTEVTLISVRGENNG